MNSCGYWLNLALSVWGLVLFIAVPFARLGRQNFQFISFYALVGIALGNVYTNAMLVRELLLLCAVFAGSYFGEVESSGSALWRRPSPATTRFASIGLLMLALAAFVEVALSLTSSRSLTVTLFGIQPLSKDGWTQGVLRIPVPPEAASAELAVVADRPDLARRPLDVEISVLSESGSLLWSQEYAFTERDSEPRELQLRIPELLNGKRFLELRPSHCFVPLNLGITSDPRHLGVRVPELRFRTAAGVETR